MRKRKIFALSSLLLILFSSFLIALESTFIEGRVVDKETKDPLPAYISVKETEIGITADFDGYFKLNLETLPDFQKITLIVWQIGYKKKEVEAVKGKFLAVELELEPISVDEIVVTADSVVSDEKSQKTVTMNRMDVYTLPGAAADPLYASHILPGVNSTPDASNALIRGGAPDEVAYFFDGIEIEHPFLTKSLHESYFSIFDNQIIENFSVSTSGFLPKFGDALSGVMDITAKDTIFKGEGGLGLSLLGFNGYIGLPLKENGSIIASYKRGHSYLMTKLNNREDSQFGTENGFGKLRFDLNKWNSLRLIGLFDKYDFSHESGFRTNSTNRIGGISLTSVLAKNLVMKFAASLTRYDVSYQVNEQLQVTSKDNAFQVRWDSALDLGTHFLEFGADIQRMKIGISVEETELQEYQVLGTRWGFYINDKFRILDNFFVNLGGRLLALDLHKNKLYFEPRFSAAYLITRTDIVRFSLGWYHQFGDYFLIRKYPELKPKYSYHFSLSYDRVTENTEMRMTIYDKEYRNLFLDESDEWVSNEGRGYARGAEFFIKTKQKRYDFIFVYNFLNSKRKENDILLLARSPYEIDHSLTGIFKLKFKRSSVGIRYSYASGLPFTPLLGREWDEGHDVYLPVWGESFSRRYPAYHRMDLNGSISFNVLKRLVVVYFGLTNIFNNKNVVRYEYSDDYSVTMNNYSIFGRSIFVGIYVPFF